MANASAIFAGIDTTQKVIDSWINHGLNFANYGLSKKQMQLQEKAFEWQKYYDQNQTQIRVNDFAKAGLNPILASGSSGGSSVSGVSASLAQPTSSPADYTGNLVQTLMQKKELEQTKQLAADKNSTEKVIADKRIEADKQIASQRAETDKYIADLNSATARLNAETNAASQERIATANNEAQKELRSALAAFHNSQRDKQDWQNLYNTINGLYDGNESSIIAFLQSGSHKVAGWLNIGVEEASKLLAKIRDSLGNLKENAAQKSYDRQHLKGRYAK